jgi:hypothetical protein
MATVRVSASEFQKEYGRYTSLAKRQAVTVTNHGRDELDTRVAMPAEALDEAQFRRLEKASPIPEESRGLDHLVPDNW